MFIVNVFMLSAEEKFLIAKYVTYGFTHEALNVMKSCLLNIRYRTKMNGSYCSFLDLQIRVPQGSIGPLLTNIFI